MLVKDILARTRPAFSFEFFPPRQPADWDALFDTIADLKQLHPSHVSVTYGAGGTTRERTHDLVLRLHQTGFTVVSHLTCVNATRDEIHEILKRYHDAGILNILALRGDPPKGQSRWTPTDGGFDFAADLVAFIRDRFPAMGVGVAGFPEGHPDTPNRLKEIDHLKAKIDAGADYVVTQLFFDNRDYLDFRDRCTLAGISVPIIAGLMPVTTRSGLIRMAELAGGARIPAALLRDVLSAPDEATVARTGTDWAAAQAEGLVREGAPGIHYYTLNKAPATREIHQRLLKNLGSASLPPGTP